MSESINPSQFCYWLDGCLGSVNEVNDDVLNKIKEKLSLAIENDKPLKQTYASPIGMPPGVISNPTVKFPEQNKKGGSGEFFNPQPQ